MPTYADFYHDSTGWNGKDFTGPVKLISACGSDAILRFDGRLGRTSQLRIAREQCKKRGFKGFTLIAGPCLLTARTIRPLEKVPLSTSS